MRESLRELLNRAEYGKMGKRGYVAPRDCWVTPGNWNVVSGYRDKTEKTEGGFNYYLWDYKLLEKKHGVLCLYSWDSVTTRERLSTISEYYNLPIWFTLHGGELYCKLFGWDKLDEWRYNKIEVDTKTRTIKIYIDNARGDIEKYNY